MYDLEICLLNINFNTLYIFPFKSTTSVVVTATTSNKRDIVWKKFPDTLYVLHIYINVFLAFMCHFLWQLYVGSYFARTTIYILYFYYIFRTRQCFLITSQFDRIFIWTFIFRKVHLNWKFNKVWKFYISNLFVLFHIKSSSNQQNLF